MSIKKNKKNLKNKKVKILKNKEIKVNNENMKTKKNINKSSHRSYSIFGFLLVVIMFLVITSFYTNASLDSESVIIENLSTYVMDSSVIIYWDTNIIADSRILYGVSNDNLTFENYFSVHSYSHAAEIIDLEPNTLYYFVVNSTNANGNSNQSEVQTFMTLEDNVSPQFLNMTVLPASESNYSKNGTYLFSANWEDNGIIKSVVLEIISNLGNGSSTTQLYNLTQSLASSYEYVANIENMNLFSAGTYYYRTIAQDIANNTNQSEQFEYVINKAQGEITLLLDGVENNIQIEQKSFVNITGLLDAGDSGITLTIKNSTHLINSTLENVSASVQIMQYFEFPGQYNVTLVYNETQNYTANSITYQINVTPIELNLFIDKPDYVLGEAVSYTLLAPNGSNITLEICGPLPIGAGFVECNSVIVNQNANYPLMGIAQNTNKVGTYKIRAQLNYKGITRLVEKNYTVSNNLQIQISGDLLLKTAEESSITASATGGVGTLRYNWTLSNGTKISGQNLNVKYANVGTYPIIITVIDNYGNYKSETRTLTVKKHYTIKVAVFDDENGGDLSGAKVKMESFSETTNSDGEAIFDLIEGDYYLKVSSQGYVSYSQTIKSDASKTITVRLAKAPSTLNEPIEISLVYPKNNYIAESAQISFEAYVDLAANKEATCYFYVAEDNSDWYRVMKTVAIKADGKITHSETFSSGNRYDWKVQCDANSKTYASQVLSFNAQNYNDEGEATLTIVGSSNNEIIDAGEIRRRIDSAQTNMDALDMESKKDAQVLDAFAIIDDALTDYERAMRDINNIIYRRDLSDNEKEVKKAEYYSILKGLENITPLNIRNLGYETFISYPSKEELSQIASDYQKQKNIIGRINEDSVSQLQNGVIVTTRISHVEITYLNNQKKIITLVDKTLKITDNATDTFLLEFVPKEFAQTTDNLVLLTEMSIVNKDPLLKLDKQSKISYYIEGQKDFELGKNIKTMILSDGEFKTRNAITGDVTFTNIDITSPTSLIVLIAIISCIYLLYAFDVFALVFEKSKDKQKEERINKILSLIKDATDYIATSKLENANLAFKEIKLLYESSSEDVRIEVYAPAVALLDMIDSAQLDILLRDAQTTEDMEKTKISREMLKGAYDILSDSLKDKYSQKIVLALNGEIGNAKADNTNNSNSENITNNQ